MNFKMIAMAAALVAAGTAHAGITKMDGVTVNGDSSVLLVMLDSTNNAAGPNVRGLTVDLGLSFSQLRAGGMYSGADQSLAWDLANNTFTINGAVQTGATNDWSGQVADFISKADMAQVKYALVAGSRRGSNVNAFLAAGTPTATQLTNQNSAKTTNMQQVDLPLYIQGANGGTLATADNGAYSMGATDTGYVGTGYNLTTVNGYLNNIFWSTWTSLGGKTNLTEVRANGSESAVGLTSTFALPAGATGWDSTGLLNDRGTLQVSADGLSVSWKTASAITPAVPEPETYALMLAGVAVATLAARRRRAQ
ncbi:PEP-CTERM sorting domain-containing protein [Aquabacterium lacunae]|uniref:PEP-CTERM sorting domain-containing protein n=1 Tax=Aquabacterium lacunae TaxID=2528630 RepID=A0A4Q9GWK5_9BURK|nr:PEP-CTERM sorting domain-containing protein [Aquabacterium lacunae]TBO29435.1 PEP-CTERM sorting domain-containing protein [Aquabacterium lacunae]